MNNQIAGDLIVSLERLCQNSDQSTILTKFIELIEDTYTPYKFKFVKNQGKNSRQFISMQVAEDAWYLVIKEGQLSKDVLDELRSMVFFLGMKLENLELNNIKEQNKELLKSNLELDNFVYRVSHDLRAPISSCLGLTDLLILENSLENVKNFAQLQSKSLKKLDLFIKDILNYSRNSRKEISPVRVVANRIIKSIYEPLYHHPEYQHIELLYEAKGDKSFVTDLQRLEVILNNIISNSCKYHNPYHDKPFVKVSFDINPKKVVIVITDNGLGIAEEHQDKIFNMFYRATDKKAGTGLGLYIVKESIDKLNGSIHLYSIPGKGSEFTIQIPNLALQK